MPRIITVEEKLSVIDDWLNGESREDITIKHDIGSGTVYNIVQEWSNEIGVQRAERLRELATKLKKNGLTVSDCAKGFRLLMIFRKYGIKEEAGQDMVTYFLEEIYTTCQEVGLTPRQVFAYISDIIEFSSEISISQIPQFMKKRTEEKKELDIAVHRLSKKINELSDRREEIEQEIERLSKMKETMTKTYKTFTIVKYRLAQYGLGMENLDHVVKCVVGIAKENYDPVQIVAKIADYENLEKSLTYYKGEVKLKKDELAKLNQDINLRRNILNYSKIKSDRINELEIMGFGMNEFRILSNMLNEIGENNQSFDEIRKKFFDTIKNYEEINGLGMEIDRLKKELKILEVETIKEREKYDSYPKIIESIIRLTGAGISEDDIIKIDKILSMTDYYLYKDKPMYKETLIDDLQKYGNIKLAIKKLKDINIDLKSKKRTQDKLLKKDSTTVKKTKRKKFGN